MKNLIPLVASFIIMGTLAGRAYTQDVLSFYPVFSERDAVLLPPVEGAWVSDFFGRDTLSFRKAGDNFYHVQYTSAGKPSFFEGVFSHAGDVLDLLPVVSDTIGNEDFRTQLVTAHTLYRVKIETDMLHVAPLNYAWFYDDIVTRKTPLSYVWSKNRMILTAPTDTLRAILVEHAHAPGFFQGDFSFYRIVTKKLADNIHDQFEAKHVAPKEERSVARQNCLPSFPLKDGWLGGDGDVSVPLSPTKTLWLFSDTFVGVQHQTSRSDAHMVSSTVAISTCEPEGQSTIRYYWRDPYTNHPKPFFESFTSRYKYWVADAFVDGNTLYVVLQKVGPKLHAVAPDDIFNFDQIGFSLAKITNPNASTPDRWNIELIPWSHEVGYDFWNGQLVKEGRYVYLFIKGRDDGARLLRISLENIESPEGYVEYYAAGGLWKTDTEVGDMEILMKGNPGQTVKYHADLKQWIMVCGPGFLNNKIRIRTAAKLTGPWSEEKVIYQCPEQTPSSATYDKDNFCYSGREHVQFYDNKDQTLVLTYDCNSADFSKLVSNTAIYSTRVISIPLKK